MNWNKVLVLTFKPAVEDAWKEDLLSHVDFKGWQFISKNADDLSSADIDLKKPLVCFGSFQDFLGKNTNTGGIKVKNEWVHATNWDIIIFDEYHFGAWRENAKDLFGKDLEAEKEIIDFKKIEIVNSEFNIEFGRSIPNKHLSINFDKTSFLKLNIEIL